MDRTPSAMDMQPLPIRTKLAAVNPARIMATLLEFPVESVIAIGRLLLTTFVLAALVVGGSPATPALVVIRTIMLGYFWISLIFFLVTERTTRRTRIAYVSHGCDVLVSSLLMHVSDGPSAPFFSFFLFILIVGALRWEWRGAFLTAGVLVGALLLLYAMDFTPAP